MEVRSIKLRNFRCFGDSPVTVDHSSDLTALVGANGSGKPAILMALTRWFGPSQGLKTIQRSEFQLPQGIAASGCFHADFISEVEGLER